MKIKRSVDIPDRDDTWFSIKPEEFWVKDAERRVTFKNVRKIYVGNIYTGSISVNSRKDVFLYVNSAPSSMASIRFENEILYNASKDVYMLTVAGGEIEVINRKLSEITEPVGKL